MKDTKKLEAARKILDEVIAYEKTWVKTHNGSIPTVKIMEYFGADTICALYGCTVSNDQIARELIIEAFK